MLRVSRSYYVVVAVAIAAAAVGYRYWNKGHRLAIEVVDASYGASCRDVVPGPSFVNSFHSGNATASVQEVCGDGIRCDYTVDLKNLSDPVNGCAKDFRVTFRCPGDDQVRAVSVAGESLGRTVRLDCQPQKIDVLTATYGGNCGNTVSPGNATAAARDQCKGDDKCVFAVDVKKLGDPAPGCAKELSVSYRCGSETLRRLTRLQPEANGHQIVLDCRVAAKAQP